MSLIATSTAYKNASQSVSHLKTFNLNEFTCTFSECAVLGYDIQLSFTVPRLQYCIMETICLC